MKCLLDDAANAEGIRQALRDLGDVAGADDTAVVFFSGHGGRKESGPESGAYLIPFNCDPWNLKSTAIHADEFSMLLSKIKAGRLVILLDACHAGGVRRGQGPRPRGRTEGWPRREDLPAPRPRDWASDHGLLTLDGGIADLARTSEQPVYALPARGLRGKASFRGDGLVRIFDVFHYVSDQVPVAANQHPIFKAHDLEKNFPLSLDQGGKQVAPPIDGRLLVARPAKLAGKARIEIRKGLVSRWADLALYFDVPLVDRSSFGQGGEAAGKLLDWLEERSKLPALRDAFRYLGMDDLITELDQNPQ